MEFKEQQLLENMMLMEEMTMEIVKELMKAVAENTEGAAEIAEAVTAIMKVAMRITKADRKITEAEVEITEVVVDITEAEMKITEAEVEILIVVVEVSEIAKTNMKKDIKMDCHEEVDSQAEEVTKTFVSFVVMVVCAKLNGWAWAALMYTS